jgi:hypothetical protein
MKDLIRFIYAGLIAISVVVFVGVTSHAVYPGPDFKDYAPPSVTVTTDDGSVGEKEQKESERLWNDYETKRKAHDRNTAIVGLVAGVVSLVIGLWLLRRADIIGEGLALGGVATTIYATMLGASSGSRVVQAIGASLLLVSVLVLVQKLFLAKPKKKR